MLGKPGLGEVASPISFSLTALLSSTKPQLSSQHLLQNIHGKTPMSYIQRLRIQLTTMSGTILQVNVTLPDWKTKELRRAYYSTISYIDSEIGRFSSLSLIVISSMMIHHPLLVVAC